MISSHVLGSRSYVSGLLIDTRVVALLGLRTHRDLITGQVDHDQKGRQILGAYVFRSMLSICRELLWLTPAQVPTSTSSRGASNAVLRLRMLQAMRASLLASATASLFPFILSDARISQSPKLKSGHRLERIRMTLAAGIQPAQRRLPLPAFRRLRRRVKERGVPIGPTARISLRVLTRDSGLTRGAESVVLDSFLH